MRWKRGNRLRLVGADDAPPRIREIFDEVCHCLGLPVVPLLYQAYAAFPGFLELHWAAFRPVLQSRQFFTLGARLAAESYTRAHNYFDISALTGYESHPEISPKLPIPQVLDYYQYLDPLLLLISAGQMQALEGPIGHSGNAEPANHPTFPVAPCLLGDAHASSLVHRIWDDRRRLMEVTVIPSEHRALACWPDFYRDYWLSLKQLLQSPVYTDCQYRLGESAWTMVHEFPVRVETEISQLLDAGLDSEQVSSVARINEAFLQALTGLVLDITFARIGCDGGTHGQTPQVPKPPTSTPKRKKTRSRTRAA